MNRLLMVEHPYTFIVPPYWCYSIMSGNKTVMYKTEQYHTPKVDVLKIAIEQGFSSSGSQLPEYDEDNDVIVIG